MSPKVSLWHPLMPHRVSVRRYAERDADNAKTYHATESFRARVVGKLRRVRNFEGQEVVSSWTVYLGQAVLGLGPEDLVTLPTGFSPASPPLVAVAQLPDQHGQHHTVLYLG